MAVLSIKVGYAGFWLLAGLMLISGICFFSNSWYVRSFKDYSPIHEDSEAAMAKLMGKTCWTSFIKQIY